MKPRLTTGKRFPENFLTHKNPYTGMSWAEDPALFAISVVNEDTIYHVWKQYPAIKEAYLKKFDKYLQDNNVNGKNDRERSRALSKFLIDLQIKSYIRMKDFLKMNSRSRHSFQMPILPTRFFWHFSGKKLDYVDNHAYWVSPLFYQKALEPAAPL